MSEFTPEELEKFKAWVESFKGPRMSSVEDALEAQREAQGVAELISRGEKGAKQYLGTLGEIAKGAGSMKASPPISPAQASAKVFEEAGLALPKNVAEDIVKSQTKLGKSAADSAKIFESAISPAAESARVFEEAGSALPKNIAEDIVKSQSRAGKTAADAAEILAPKELPAISAPRPTTDLVNQGKQLPKRIVRIPEVVDDTIKAVGEPLDDFISTTGRRVGEESGILGRFGKYIPAVGLGIAGYETMKGDVVEGGLTGTETLLGMATKNPYVAVLDLLRPTTMMNEEQARASEMGLSIPKEEALKRKQEREIRQDLKARGFAEESVFPKDAGSPPLVVSSADASAASVAPEIKSIKEQKSSPVTKSSVSTGIKEDTSPEATLSEAIKAESQKQKQPQIDFMDLLRKAQDSQSQIQLLANLGKAAETIGSGITGVVPGGKVTKTTGTDFYDKLIKQAEQPVEDVGTMYTMKTKQDEMDRLARRRDPASEESMFARALLKQQGITVPEAATAEALEKYAPQLTNILNQREAREGRAEVSRENREARKQELQIRMAEIASRKDLSTDQKQEAFIQSLRKETTSGAHAKLFTNFNTTKKIAKALAEFEKDPSGYTDYATLLGGLKALQGDESVVREAEIRLGMNAASFADKVKNWTDTLISGRSLQKDQIQQIIKSVRILSDVARNQYKEGIQPIMNQAESLGIDPKKLVGEGVLDDSLQPSTKKESSKKQIGLPKKYLPGSRLTTKQGTFIVDSSGDTATEE